MLSPPTDRLHKFLAIAGIALFIVGVTIPLDRYDQSVRQFIEAKSKAMELGRAQLRYSQMLDSEHKKATSLLAAPGSTAAVADRVQPDASFATIEREIADLSGQAQTQLELAEHAERIRAIWTWLGVTCVFGGAAMAALGFVIWCRQPANER